MLQEQNTMVIIYFLTSVNGQNGASGWVVCWINLFNFKILPHFSFLQHFFVWWEYVSINNYWFYGKLTYLLTTLLVWFWRNVTFTQFLTFKWPWKVKVHLIFIWWLKSKEQDICWLCFKFCWKILINNDFTGVQTCILQMVVK